MLPHLIRTGDPVATRQHKISAVESAVIDEFFANGFKKGRALKEYGYSEKTQRQPYRFFARPAIEYEVEKRKRAAAEAAGVNQARVLQELYKIATFNMGEILDIREEDGTFTIDLRELTPEMQSVLSEATVETYIEGRGEDAQTVKRIRVKPHDKNAALDKLMRYFGAYKDRLTILDQDIEKQLDAGRKRVAAAKRGEDNELAAEENPAD